jgi:hypothetical protein
MLPELFGIQRHPLTPRAVPLFAVTSKHLEQRVSINY